MIAMVLPRPGIQRRGPLVLLLVSVAVFFWLVVQVLVTFNHCYTVLSPQPQECGSYERTALGIWVIFSVTGGAGLAWFAAATWNAMAGTAVLLLTALLLWTSIELTF